MNEIHISNLDLNLLYLFSVVYEERSVTRAAERLFVSPSAVSHSLGRLRRFIGDDLFIRGASGMTPTPRAQEIAERLRRLLPQLQDVVAPRAFSPATSTRSFGIATIPYLTNDVLPAVAVAFNRAAPDARLAMRLLDYKVAEDLDAGALDVALGNFRRTPPQLIVEDLFEEQTVWVGRRDEGARIGKLSLRALVSRPHIDVLFNVAIQQVNDGYDVRHGLERLVMQDSLAAVEAACSKAGLERNVRWTASDSTAAMRIAARSEGVALVPYSAALHQVDALGLTIYAAPYRSSPLRVQMLYHSEHGKQKSVSWLLDIIRDSVVGDGRVPATSVQNGE